MNFFCSNQIHKSLSKTAAAEEEEEEKKRKRNGKHIHISDDNMLRYLIVFVSFFRSLFFT